MHGGLLQSRSILGLAFSDPLTVLHQKTLASVQCCDSQTVCLCRAHLSICIGSRLSHDLLSEVFLDRFLLLRELFDRDLWLVAGFGGTRAGSTLLLSVVADLLLDCLS